MRICLLSLTYPPAQTEGIARQRRVLAVELVRIGHEVHVVTLGSSARTRLDEGVHVHELPQPVVSRFSQKLPVLDVSLSDSQALYEGLQQLVSTQTFDVVDVPLWAAQGFVTLQHYHGPCVLWLQTTRAQIMAVNNQRASADQRALLALDQICLQRAHGLLADSTEALRTILQDYAVQPAGPAGVVHLGLPELPHPTSERLPNSHVEAIIVGRLERRKGTPLLFEVLPELLRRQPQLRVRFVGRDNSTQDGWFEQRRETYPDYFRRCFPELAEKVIFEGYVGDHELAALYRQADILVVPSLYESFGLVYLEGMRAGLPVVTFGIGAATEIFAQNEDNGAVLVPPFELDQFVTAITKLVQDPELRSLLGQRGLGRFQAAFRAEAMAAATVEFYEQVVSHEQSPPLTREVYQVMEALDVGDAVSNIARYNATLLQKLGQPRAILARYTNPLVAHETRPLSQALAGSPCSLIFHYWGYNTSSWLVKATPGRHAVHYHNITPPHYFPEGSVLQSEMARGYTQLSQIADQFDFIIGDSRYNITEFLQYVHQSRPTLPIYPVVEPDAIQAEAVDTRLLESLRQPGWTNIVFVGRIARNKCQHELIRLFDYYYREVNRYGRLFLVGNDQSDRLYREDLERLRGSLACGQQILFTGKVSDPAMYAYFRAADVFVCASEHEGFCVPIIQAMALDIPVLAFAAAAVPETMGSAGALVHKWDVPRVGELMHLMSSDCSLREHIIAGQRTNLLRFSAAQASQRLAAVVSFLQTGTPNALFEWREPVLQAS